MDLAVWWQQRRWVGLLELIDNLPTTSRLNEAAQNDPEQARLLALAREYAEDDEAAERWSPRPSEYDLAAMLLREIAHNTAAIAGVKKPHYIPAPRTEVDRQLEQIALLQAVSVGSRYGFDATDFGVVNPAP